MSNKELREEDLPHSINLIYIGIQITPKELLLELAKALKWIPQKTKNFEKTLDTIINHLNITNKNKLPGEYKSIEEWIYIESIDELMLLQLYKKNNVDRKKMLFLEYDRCGIYGVWIIDILREQIGDLSIIKDRLVKELKATGLAKFAKDLDVYAIDDII